MVHCYRTLNLWLWSWSNFKQESLLISILKYRLYGFVLFTVQDRVNSLYHVIEILTTLCIALCVWEPTTFQFIVTRCDLVRWKQVMMNAKCSKKLRRQWYYRPWHYHCFLLNTAWINMNWDVAVLHGEESFVSTSGQN